MGLLKEKQRQLADVEAMIAGLEKKFNASVAEKQSLEDAMALTAARLVRAGRLNVALGDEQIRWEQGVKVSKKITKTCNMSYKSRNIRQYTRFRQHPSPTRRKQRVLL